MYLLAKLEVHWCVWRSPSAWVRTWRSPAEWKTMWCGEWRWGTTLGLRGTRPRAVCPEVGSWCTPWWGWGTWRNCQPLWVCWCFGELTAWCCQGRKWASAWAPDHRRCTNTTPRHFGSCIARRRRLRRWRWPLRQGAGTYKTKQL